MEIRRLNDNEIDQVIELGEFAFQGNFSKEDREDIRSRIEPSNIWGAFEGERLASKVSMLPMNVYVQGVAMKACGVTGVSTWPEHRRGGLVRTLIKHALTDMVEKGQTLSLLDPFSVGYYRKFGWELYCDHSTAVFTSKEQFPKPSKDGTGSFDHVTKENWQRLQDVYQQLATRYTGMINRDEWWWLNRKFNHFTKTYRAIIYVDQHGEDRGYLFYKIKENELVVPEFVALNEEAYEQLWRFIADHDSMAKTIKVRQLSQTPWQFYLDNPQVKEERKPFFMARIVDAQRFLEQYPFQLEDGESVTFAITDEFAEWNNGNYHVERTHVETLADARSDAITVDIRTLVPLLFRYIDLSILRERGQLSISDDTAQLLERAIPKYKPNLLDAF
ncbi:LOW QUALITY PROTEIN: hypothetical protein JCM19055_2711 [Geomicrobium sp. JCM 19055]|nr:LOW QUALITY PROTEIN: hypothetical protein JCM19055_2711 [Geomicrobium sp. JCM 19055]